MWLPEIQPRSGPTTQRIVEALAEAIAEGRLEPGAQLPPHRELADSLGLSVGTVSRAYSIAKDRGLITGTVGRGTFVAAPGDEAEDAGGTLDLTQNFIRWDPGESVARLLRAALHDRGDLRTLMEVYPDPAGRPDHRRIASHWLARRGLTTPEEQVVITNGAQHGMLTVLGALTKPGDVIATEHLTYPGVKTIASQLQLRLAGLPMDPEGLVPEAFDRLCVTEKIRVLYTIPTIQNPTGALMSEDRRETIADIARRRNITILEDDIYAFLVDRPPPPIAAFAPERCYFVTSLSKGVFPGLRLGFVVCPPGGAERVAGMVRTSMLTVSPLAAGLGTGWLEDGTADRIMKWKRTEMRWRWQMASQFFGLDTGDTHFAAHLWLPLPSLRDPEELVARVRERGVLLAAPEAFAVDSAVVPRAVRICLGVPITRARLHQALQVIAEALEGRSTPGQLI
ncbi:MAG: PLP-dependent aminotransferase family protein [Acidobacteriia bacterium]|nr:PLP-dependent aminotransferase family protein [Terriglobia bacterium]